jgi:hypothetical protein
MRRRAAAFFQKHQFKMLRFVVIMVFQVVDSDSPAQSGFRPVIAVTEKMDVLVEG